jgi:hypothetical protein
MPFKSYRLSRDILNEMKNMRKIESGHAREAKAAVERAKELSETQRPPTGDLFWYHEALHVGDLSVLALALTD